MCARTPIVFDPRDLIENDLDEGLRLAFDLVPEPPNFESSEQDSDSNERSDEASAGTESDDTGTESDFDNELEEEEAISVTEETLSGEVDAEQASVAEWVSVATALTNSVSTSSEASFSQNGTASDG